MRELMRRLVLVAAAVLLLAGCGGGGGSSHPSATTPARPSPSRPGGGEEEEGGAGLARLPAADRHTYLQIASVTGVLNKDASLLAVSGIMHREDTAALPVLRRRIAVLRPRNALLRRLRGQTLAAIDLSGRSRRRLGRARRAAPRVLRDISRITAGLRRYAKAHPEVGGFVPD